MSHSVASLSACPASHHTCPPTGLMEPLATCYRIISNRTRGHPEKESKLWPMPGPALWQRAENEEWGGGEPGRVCVKLGLGLSW